ncbi:uncharacterized protein LOC100413948 isoform X2 [Callithrix jacchus]
MFVEKVCQVSPFPPLLLVLLILFIVQQHSRQPLSTGLSLHQVGACRDHRRADLTKLLERPAHICCLPSSPPISSSTHCFLTRSTPWKGSHQVTPLHWRATCSYVGRGLAESAEELQMEVEEAPLMGPTTPDPSLPSSWFGPTPSPGFLRGKGPRMWDPSPLQLEIPPQPRGRPAPIPTGQAGPRDSGPGAPP